MTRRPTHDQRRALNTMRNLLAAGITDQAALTGTAADVLGGDETAKATAQRVYDEHFKITEAN